MNEPTRKAYEDLTNNKPAQVKTRLRRYEEPDERKQAIVALVTGETFLPGVVDYTKTEFVDYDLLVVKLEQWASQE